MNDDEIGTRANGRTPMVVYDPEPLANAIIQDILRQDLDLDFILSINGDAMAWPVFGTASPFPID